MWSFKVKEITEEPDPLVVAVEALREFRDVGETFNYRGIDMIVESHVEMSFGEVRPILTAAYKNDYGELKHAAFLRRELPALMAENQENK